jgi:nitrate reductase gamma subunit
MEAWLEWARGPVFVFSFAFMVLGLVRHVVITVAEMYRTMKRAGDPSLAYRKVIGLTVAWLVPVGKIRNEVVYSVTSILFHVAILIVPIFLGGHIVLWARGLGVSWPAIPHEVAEILTIVAIVTAVALFVQRVGAKATRSLSRFQDYVLPPLIAVPFVTGFMMTHTAFNPFSFETVFFVHIMSANLIFILMPITKLSHAVLIPSVQLVAEMGWKWPAESGSKVGTALGKEEAPV